MKTFIIALMLVFSTAVFANGDHHHHEGEDGQDGQDGIDGVDGVDGTNGVSGINGVNGLDGNNGIHKSNLNIGVASVIAVSQIDFSSSTNQWQIGVGLGTYDGEQAVAFGAGKLVSKYDMLFKVSGTAANSELGLGVGLMWKIK